MIERKEIDCLAATQYGVDGHRYKEVERYEDGCGVSVMKCEHCGHFSVGWWRADSPPGPAIDGRCEECGAELPNHKPYCRSTSQWSKP